MLHFEDAPDRGRVIVFGADTGGDGRDFGPHQHADIEEVSVIRQGSLDFLLGDTVTTLYAQDVVRVPPGTRHGYLNHSGHDVEMMVMFSPGGFEELFVKYRTDHLEAIGEGFVADALRLFATEFET